PLAAKARMTCQRIGLPPTSTIGFGLYSVSSRKRVPLPPQRITTGHCSSATRRGYSTGLPSSAPLASGVVLICATAQEASARSRDDELGVEAHVDLETVALPQEGLDGGLRIVAGPPWAVSRTETGRDLVERRVHDDRVTAFGHERRVRPQL